MKTYQPRGTQECQSCAGTGVRNVVLSEAGCGLPGTSKNVICGDCGGKGWSGTPLHFFPLDRESCFHCGTLITKAKPSDPCPAYSATSATAVTVTFAA
jgi:hypothetical protein